MLDNATPHPAVNQNLDISSTDLVWGADAIGAVIGRTDRQIYHLLASGALKSAKRIGGRWVASRAALLRELGA
jgi:hypothetical protein